MRDRAFGPKRVMHLCRAVSAMAAGLSLSLPSDVMVTEPERFHRIQMAVTRKTWAEQGIVVNPDERISMHQTSRAVTCEAAWQLGSEHEAGSLQPDPREVLVERIKDIRVLETGWTGGRSVWPEGASCRFRARARRGRFRPMWWRGLSCGLTDPGQGWGQTGRLR